MNRRTCWLWLSPESLGCQPCERFANQLLRPIAEHFRNRIVDVDDLTCAVDQDESIGSKLQEDLSGRGVQSQDSQFSMSAASVYKWRGRGRAGLPSFMSVRG